MGEMRDLRQKKNSNARQ